MSICRMVRCFQPGLAAGLKWSSLLLPRDCHIKAHAASISKRSSSHIKLTLVVLGGPWSIEQHNYIPTDVASFIMFLLFCCLVLNYFYDFNVWFTSVWFAAGSQECGPRFWLERCSGASQSKCVYVLNVREPIEYMIVDVLQRSNDFQNVLVLNIEISHVFFSPGNWVWPFLEYILGVGDVVFRRKWTWFWSELTTIWRDCAFPFRYFSVTVVTLSQSMCCWMMCSIYFYMICQ